ncbi:MAG TPA: helix-turn-helix domain-containing protein, partial [Gemmatimonadales bacterium]|nr:helix-turn-helix domain-containing protein [Gemmatimonadales bacterium]
AFRADLFYRLDVVTITLPPLRERQEDILPLVESILQRLAQERGAGPRALSQDTMDAIMVYDWPGNVRELENTLEHAVVMTRGDTIEPAALPERLTRRRRESLVADRVAASPTLEAIERAYIMWVLQAEGGNKTRAAEVLGIDPSTLYRKLSRYETLTP